MKALLLWATVLVTVDATGVIIKTGVVKNHGEAQNANLHDVKFHQGIANLEGEEGFNRDDEKNSILAQDSGSYGEQAANKQAHLDSNNFQNDNFRQNGGDHVGNVASKVGHHKGHHKSGFTNSYHKDESGHNSSYFDDGNDEGDHTETKNYRDTFGDNQQRFQGGGTLDSAQQQNGQARRGQYDNSGRYEKDRNNQRNYNRNNYYDTREDLDRRNQGNGYQGEAQYIGEDYQRRPHYPLPYHDIRRPNKQRITIYEDPRYVHQADQRYRRSDDYIDIDVVNHRPYHDDSRWDYYY